MRTRILLLGTTLLAGACSGSPADPDPHAVGLFGTWDIQSVCGGLAGGCTERDGRLIVEAPDRLRLEGAAPGLDGTHRFRVRPDVPTPYGTNDAIDIWRDDPGEWQWWMTILEATDTRLLLGDNYADGYVTELTRAD